MSAQLDPGAAMANAHAGRTQDAPHPELAPDALAWRADRRLADRTSGGRLGPARGLLLGLVLGLGLWAGLIALAWRML